MQTLPHVLELNVVRFHAEYDRGRPILSGAAAGENSVPGIWGRSCGRVPIEPPQDSERSLQDLEVGGGSGGGSLLPGILPKDSGGDWMPSPGLHRGGGGGRTEPTSGFAS